MSSATGYTSNYVLDKLSAKIRPAMRLALVVLGVAQQGITNLYPTGVRAAAGWRLFGQQLTAPMNAERMKQERRRIKDNFIETTDANWARRERIKRFTLH